MDLQYRRNEFHTLYAKMKIRVGGQHNIVISQGDQCEYDGMVLKYAGMEVPLGPGMRSSIAQGWFTLDEDEANGGGVDAFVPGRNVAISKTKNEMERGDRVQRRQDNQMETDSHDEDIVMNVSERRPNARPDKSNPAGNVRAEPRVITVRPGQQQPARKWKSSGLVVNPGTIEEQDYTPVARMRTSAKVKVDMTQAESSQLSAKLNNLSGSGAIPLRQREDYVEEREGVTIRTNVSTRMNRNAPVEIGEEDSGEVVGQVRHTSRNRGNAEGVSVTDTSNIRAERAKPAPAKIDMKLPPKIRMARRVDPEFPADWSFEGKLKDRMEAVKKHGATPEFLEALYAAEGDQMRKQLEKTYPKQFGA